MDQNIPIGCRLHTAIKLIINQRDSILIKMLHHPCSNTMLFMHFEVGSLACNFRSYFSLKLIIAPLMVSEACHQTLTGGHELNIRASVKSANKSERDLFLLP